MRERRRAEKPPATQPASPFRRRRLIAEPGGPRGAQENRSSRHSRPAPVGTNRHNPIREPEAAKRGTAVAGLEMPHPVPLPFAFDPPDCSRRTSADRELAPSIHGEKTASSRNRSLPNTRTTSDS